MLTVFLYLRSEFGLNLKLMCDLHEFYISSRLQQYWQLTPTLCILNSLSFAALCYRYYMVTVKAVPHGCVIRTGQL